MIDVLERLGFRPRACVWELTLTCNLQCKHCGSFASPKSGRENELTYDECMSVADQLVALGCQQVTLGGGEPTLHPHWHDIGRRLTDGGARVNMISNGWKWGDRELERAQHAGLSNVAFSLDGFEQEHDHQRRKGSFARVVAAIDSSRKAGLPVAVNTTINNINKNSLRELRAFLAEHDVFSWQMQFATPSGTLTKHMELVIDPAELIWLVPLIAEMRAEEGVVPTVCPGDDVGYYGKCETVLRDQQGGGSQLPFWIGCRAGCQVIGIESNGNIKGCLSLPSAMHGEDRFVEGNIRQADDLAEVWQRPGAFAYNRDFTEDQLDGFCAVCRYRQFCRGGCTWTAFSHTKNRFDNPYCFYREAVRQRRTDLLDEAPLPEEAAFFADEPEPSESK